MSTEKQLLHSPHRRIYLLLCVSRTRTKFADAVRRIGNVASGKWKEKQQQTNRIERQTATRQFWNRNRNRNRGAINSAISAHKTYLCSSALNYVNTFAANWVVSRSLSLTRCGACSAAHCAQTYLWRTKFEFIMTENKCNSAHTRTLTHNWLELWQLIRVKASAVAVSLPPSPILSLSFLRGAINFHFNLWVNIRISNGSEFFECEWMSAFIKMQPRHLIRYLTQHFR